MDTNRRKLFGVLAAAGVAAALPRAQAQSTTPNGNMAVIVSSNGSIYGLFSTLADANAYVAAQTTPSAYNVQAWLITPAGQSTPLNGSNNN